MELRDHYDWIVLGDHPGALISACLAARLGLSVLVLSLHRSHGLSVSQKGVYLDPETNVISGLGKAGHLSGLVTECMGRFGIAPAETALIRYGGAAPQILTPSVRLGMEGDDRRFREEFAREFGANGAKEFPFLEVLRELEETALSFWLRLPERLTLQRPGAQKQRTDEVFSVRQLHRELAKIGSSTAMKNPAGRAYDVLFDGIWHGLNLGHCARLEWADLVQAIALRRVAASFQGGMTAYRDFLRRTASRLGAHVPDKAQCKRIFVDNGKFVGAQITSRGKMIGALGGVLGCGLDLAREELAISGRTWENKIAKPPRPRGWKFTISVIVSQEALPPGFSPFMVWQEEGAPALEIEVADPADFRLKSKDRRLIFLRTLLPFRQESLSVDHQRIVAARMFRQLTEIMPFLEYHVASIYPDFRHPDRDEFSEAYGFPMVELVPENLRSYAEPGIGSRSGVEGLFVASGESCPELGSLGGVVAALEAVSWVAHRSGLAGPFA